MSVWHIRSSRFEPCRAALLLLAFVGALAVACAPTPEPGTWWLYTALMECGELEVVAPPGVLAEKAERLAERMRADEYVRLRVSVQSPSEAATPRGPRAARVRLGTLDEPEVAELAARAGVERLSGGGFRVLGQDHSAASDAFVLTMADPARPGLPMVLVAGSDAELLAARALEIPAAWQPTLRTWSGSGEALSVSLELDGSPSQKSVLDRSTGRRQRWESAFRERRGGLVFHVDHGVSADRLTEYMGACERAVQRAVDWAECEAVPEAEPIEVLVYAHAEDFERDHGRARLATFERASGKVHALLAPGLPHDGGAAIVRAMAYAMLGEPAEAWVVDGLAVAAAGTWWGRSLASWHAHLTHAQLLPPVASLRDPRSDTAISEHVLLPARGSVVRGAVRTKGALRRIWHGEEMVRLEVSGFGDGELVEAERAEHAARAAALGGESPRGAALFATAPGDPALRSPYLERSVAASLAELGALGADSFSLTIQVAVQPLEATLVAARPTPVHCRSSDVALASAIAAGRAHGLSACLVLEPLFAPWSTWGDGALFTSDAEIALFFRHFERMVRHYALLAELLSVERLCLGSALTSASNTIVRDTDPSWVREAKGRRAARWDTLIATARRSFSGALTYAARTPQEISRIAFWDRLDAVGLFGFPAITSAGAVEPSDRRIRSCLKRELEVAVDWSERLGRPVLYVQLGFPARERSWDDPFMPRGNVAPERQERYYAALAAVLAEAQGEFDSVGIFVWNWDPRSPANPARGGGYSPRGMPAESHLRSILAGP